MIGVPKVELNGETILVIIAGIVIVAEIISALSKGKEGWGNLSGKNARIAAMAKIEQRVSNLETDMSECQRKLEKNDDDFKGIRKDLAQVMDVLDGILLHFISGNDKETLKKVKVELDHYKSRRGADENEE